MEEWKEYKLGELTERKIGYGIVQPGEHVPNGIPVIKVNNIISGLKCISDLDRTSIENDEKYKRTRLNGGEVIISIVGTIGKTAIVPKQFAGSNLVRATALIDIPDADKALWVKYYIDSPLGQAYIKGNLNTTVQPTLNIKSLIDMPIRMYSTEYMDKAIRILKSLDDKIEVNRRINEQLEELAQALFKSWFVDFEPFKDGEFVESELGMIPKGWKVGTLGDITTEQKTKVGNRNDVKVLSPITSGNLVLSEEFFSKQVYSKSIAKYLVVMPYDFAYNPARVNIGSLGMNEFDFDGCVSPVYVVFRCNEGYCHFFDLYRKRQSFKDEVASRAMGGVRQTLAYKDFSMISVVYPPVEIVKQFNETYMRLKDAKSHNSEEITHLTNLRDTLLPKLMSGEIDVEQFNVIE